VDEQAPDEPGDATPSAARDDAGTSAARNEAPPDEVLHLLYRNGLTAPRFSATLHEWFDLGAVLAAVPPPARGAGFGGVGFLVDAVRDAAQESAAGSGHAMSKVRMGGWNEYRIDLVRPAADAAAPGSGNGENDQALTIASDGTRQWQVYADRV